jgi:hypothetical protein
MKSGLFIGRRFYVTAVVDSLLAGGAFIRAEGVLIPKRPITGSGGASGRS